MSKRPITNKLSLGSTTQAAGEGVTPETAPTLLQPAPEPPVTKAASAETAAPPATPSVGLDRIAPKPEAEPRTGLTIRLRNSDGERLRNLAHQTRRTKQDLLDLAIREFLERNGV